MAPHPAGPGCSAERHWPALAHQQGPVALEDVRAAAILQANPTGADLPAAAAGGINDDVQAVAVRLEILR